MENFNIMQANWKGGHKEKTVYKWELSKKEGRRQFADLREGFVKKEGNALYVDYQLSPGCFLPCIL